MTILATKYRTHNCVELNKKHINQKIILSGWVHSKRDHGGVIFIDLRDHYGLVQIVTDNDSKNSIKPDDLQHISCESVITISGTVRERKNGVKREDISTGEIEILIESLAIQSNAKNVLPFSINEDKDCKESLRLEYRFLDLRREQMQKNIVLRSKICQWIREKMHSLDFNEITTPILTASSPEGANDFLVPSRLHPGKFYALPQAPQQFKQLLMSSGFDKYFQIAPCFRDENARADRSPGEFYQLDLEMSFVEQEDVLNVTEEIITELFKKFSDKEISSPFVKIKYDDAMLKYGTDKPDLRNPIVNSDVTDIFANSGLSIFSSNISKGCVMRAIPAPKASEKPRSFFDNMIPFAQKIGAKGLAYIVFDKEGQAKGPIAKLMKEEELTKLKKIAGVKNGDGVFLSCDKEEMANKIASSVRIETGRQLGLIDENKFAFCWIIDFPYFELDNKKWNTKTNEPEIDPNCTKLTFSHNPFSMPQGGLEALQSNDYKELLKIKAYQYDIVCNGIELSSGAIRNHRPEILWKAFEIAGYNKEDVEKNFAGMINAFQYGTPPHGGIAPGIDRIIMLLTDAKSIREVIAFPMNGQAEDLLMNAPSYLPPDKINIVSKYVEEAKKHFEDDE